MIITSHSEDDTVRAADNLARDLQDKQIIALYGDLGAGKTVFARALVRALTNDPELEVPSPTFTLVQIYESGSGPVHHFDLYRLEDPEEIFELGWEEALAEGITIIEWPERLGALKPKASLDIRISGVDNTPDQRMIQITRNA